jgi:hypothetical protein
MRTVRVRLESGVTGAGIEPAARALKEHSGERIQAETL